MSNPLLCRHCHTGPVNRPRGLCWACYYTPGVVDLYPSTSKFAPKNPHRGPRSKEKVEAACQGQWGRSVDGRRRRDLLPGDPPYRCFWCDGWLCFRPFTICAACEKEYQQLIAGMATVKEEDD